MKRILLLLFALVDCGVSGKTAEPTSAGPPVTVVAVPASQPESAARLGAPGQGAPVPAASAVASASTSADAGPALCGCQLCAPLPSDDACATDADCAPSAPCHAPACVAKAKAAPRSRGTVCTMLLACASADVNGCGCRAGRCALYPR